MNDVFAIINAAPAIALLSYGFFNRGIVPGLCFGAVSLLSLFTSTTTSFFKPLRVVFVFVVLLLRKRNSLFVLQLRYFSLALQGLGITVFGMAYMFVHDGLVHRRFPVGPIAKVPYLRRVAAAHQVKFILLHILTVFLLFFWPS